MALQIDMGGGGEYAYVCRSLWYSRSGMATGDILLLLYIYIITVWAREMMQKQWNNAAALCLPTLLLLFIHLHILEYTHANNAEYDHNIFSPCTRGLQEHAKTMEDVVDSKCTHAHDEWEARPHLRQDGVGNMSITATCRLLS